jgi:hypothetical protein
MTMANIAITPIFDDNEGMVEYKKSIFQAARDPFEILADNLENAWGHNKQDVAIPPGMEWMAGRIQAFFDYGLTVLSALRQAAPGSGPVPKTGARAGTSGWVLRAFCGDQNSKQPWNLAVSWQGVSGAESKAHLALAIAAMEKANIHYEWTATTTCLIGDGVLYGFYIVEQKA